MQPKDLIKDRLSIVDVISSYLPVVPSGKNYKARCPFHNEKTPSFFISPDRGTYYCFGCGEKGDIFSFVEKFEGTDFLGSLKLLAERAGVPLTYNRNSAESKDEKERWFATMEDATAFFESNLGNNAEARAYLSSRGLSPKTIETFRIGFAKDEWRSVSDFLISKGYSKEDIEKVGLSKRSEKGYYDRFRSRIMFPVSDSSGRVIAFSGRIFNKPDSEEGKYINSPDSPLYNKSNVLFGIDKAKTAIRTRGYSIVVEGQMDLIMSHQAGFTNTVAVSGTALSDSLTDNEAKINNLGLIRRLSTNVIFAYDGDEAGIRAAGRSARIALSLDMQVKVAILPEGQDPADIILASPDVWKEIIKHSTNIISFHIERICKQTSDIRKRGQHIREIVFPFLAMVTSAIERSAYVNEIHNATGIATEAIIEDFKLYEKRNPSKSESPVVFKDDTTPGESRRGNLEKRLFGIVFWVGQDDSAITSLCSEFLEYVGKDEFEAMKARYEPFSEALASEAEMWYNNEVTSLARDIQEILLSLEEEILSERKLSLLTEISKGESDDSSTDLKPILEQYQHLLHRIEYIKNKRHRE